MPGAVANAEKPIAARALPDSSMKLCPDEIFHPLSQLFPEMSPERFVILKLDINEHGIRVPVLMYEGKVLDGRARWRAAQELGIPCPTVEYDGSTPVLELLSLNAIRRDMSSGQRAITAAKLANLVEGRPTKTASIDGVSEDRAARLLDVSVRAVQRAKKILKANRTDLIAAVGSGSMSISRAAKITSTGVSGTATPTESSTKSLPTCQLTQEQDHVWLWKEMLNFEQMRIMDRRPADLLAQMTEEQAADALRIAPTLISWLQVLVAERWDIPVVNS